MIRDPHSLTTCSQRVMRIAVASAVAIFSLVPFSAATSTAKSFRASAGPTDTTMWELLENATINNDPSPAADQVVRLSPAQTNKKGFALYRPTIPASQGVDITFMMAHWGGTGADGISFFVKDARDTTKSFGAYGHPLGYGTRSGIDGLASALLGIGFGAGFDSADVDGTGCTYSSTPTRISLSDANRKQTISLRGGPGYNTGTSSSNNRRANYCLLADPRTVETIAPFNSSYTSRAAAARAARITIDPLSAIDPRVKVYYGDTVSNMSLVFDVAAPANLVGVPSLKVGFAGATGAATNNHEVWGLTTPTETYDIIFDGQGGTLSTTSGTYTKETGASPLPLPTVTPRSGYDFVGWYSASTGGTELAGPTDTSFTPTAPGTVYARWVAHQTVTFNANGGSGTAATQSSGIPKALSPNTFTRAGYTFAGWSTSPKGPMVYADGAIYPFSATDTLYAKWTAVSATTTTIGVRGSTTTVAHENPVGTSPDEGLSSSGSRVASIALAALALLGIGTLARRSRRALYNR